MVYTGNNGKGNSIVSKTGDSTLPIGIALAVTGAVSAAIAVLTGKRRKDN